MKDRPTTKMPSADAAAAASPELGTARRRRCRTFLTATALAIATVGLAAPAPADAMVIGPSSSVVPGSSYTDTGCTRGRLRIQPYVNVDAGFTGGQYISYRYHLTNNRGYAGTSAWSQAQLVPFRNYVHVPLAQTLLTAQMNTTWTVQVQIARWRWTGSAWVATYSAWQYSDYSTFAGVSAVNCLT